MTVYERPRTHIDIKIRRDTAANWTTNNPILAVGEMGYETDTYKLKVGDGTTVWASLPYMSGTGSGGVTSLSSLTDVTVTSVSTSDVLLYNGATWVNTPFSIDRDIEGGSPSDVYLTTQLIDGGSPSVVYLSSQLIDGESP